MQLVQKQLDVFDFGKLRSACEKRILNMRARGEASGLAIAYIHFTLKNIFI